MDSATNKYFLNDGTGRSFPINVDGENTAAWADKKAFIISVGEQELAHNKAFSVAVLRQLAVGMISVKEGKKNKTKAELIEGFAELIREARELGALRYEALQTLINDAGFDAKRLDMMLTSLSGQALASAIENSLRSGGYVTSSIVKTFLPDIYKAIRAYGNEDAEDVVRLVKNAFHEDMQAVNDASEARIMENSNNVRPIKWEPLQAFLDSLDINNASWKELSVYLALATGRRCAEIHGEATAFTYIDDANVMFTGQLKTRDRDEENAPYPIKTYVPSSKLIAAWERLCILKPPMSPDAVSKKLSKPLSSEKPLSIEKLYKASGLEQYKDMRDVYAAKRVLERPLHLTPSVFVGKCMGHSQKHIKAAETYQKIRIMQPNEDSPQAALETA